jgi:pilus assembly protein Flp/PilA
VHRSPGPASAIRRRPSRAGNSLQVRRQFVASGGAVRRLGQWRNEMKNMLMRFVREEEGQDLVEYALLITFIALACIVGMQQLGTAINNRYQSISSSLQTGS